MGLFVGQVPKIGVGQVRDLSHSEVDFWKSLEIWNFQPVLEILEIWNRLKNDRRVDWESPVPPGW